MLCDHGVLVPGAARPAPPVARVTTGPGRSGMSLYLLLSQGCNLACTYCLAGAETYCGGGKPARMPAEIARAAVERCLRLLAPDGRLEIVFFGGEPLLNWPLARQILRWLEEEWRPAFPGRRIHAHITTNLTLFPDDLIELAQHHHMSFLVDVDGPPDLHDAQRPMRGGGPSHHATAAHIARLRQAGIEVALRATITGRSVDRMVEITRHHRELGGSGSAHVPVNPIDSDERVLPADFLPAPARYADGLRAVLADGAFPIEKLFPFSEYLPRVRKGQRLQRACGAPYGNTPVVDSAGDVYPCIYWVGIPRLRQGNLADGEPLANEGVIAELGERLHVDHLPRCRACDWRYLCGGGCPVQRVTLAGHPRATPAALAYADDIPCATARTVIEEILWHQARVRAAGG